MSKKESCCHRRDNASNFCASVWLSKEKGWEHSGLPTNFQRLVFKGNIEFTTFTEMYIFFKKQFLKDIEKTRTSNLKAIIQLGLSKILKWNNIFLCGFTGGELLRTYFSRMLLKNSVSFLYIFKTLKKLFSRKSSWWLFLESRVPKYIYR